MNALTSNLTYRQLQQLAKQLRSENYYTGRVDLKYDIMMSKVNEALTLKNEWLIARNNQQVFGNQAPRLQAGSRANLMERSKARKERENAVSSTKDHNKLNKDFYKRQQELSGVASTEKKQASTSFSYKQMKHSNGYMTNGCSF